MVFLDLELRRLKDDGRIITIFQNNNIITELDNICLLMQIYVLTKNLYFKK
jgi:hypothetical protein